MQTVNQKIVLERIRRRARAKGEALRITRGERHRHNLGDFYFIDTYRNCVVSWAYRWHELEEVARDMGALDPDEKLIEA